MYRNLLWKWARTCRRIMKCLGWRHLRHRQRFATHFFSCPNRCNVTFREIYRTLTAQIKIVHPNVHNENLTRDVSLYGKNGLNFGSLLDSDPGIFKRILPSSNIARLGIFPQFGSFLWKKNWSDLYENFATDLSLGTKSPQSYGSLMGPVLLFY